MVRTILAKLSSGTTDDNRELESSNRFLKQIGIELGAIFYQEIICFELIQTPDVISQMESNTELFPFHQDKVWNLTSISPFGITLQVFHLETANAEVFVPMNNILAIHTADKKFFNALLEAQKNKYESAEENY
jgi:hypothetical protein